MEENNLNRPKVSVCISVHNTAKYLPRCLDSVCSQTLQSIEIVVVNNGSTDNSEAIMHEYAEKHPERQFVIISQADKSLAGGRQTGINHATGEYITFLDADDLVDSTAYQKMLNCAEKECVDIVEIQTRRDGEILESKLEGLQDAHEVLKQYFTKGGIQSMLWMRMYKRSLFNKVVLPTIYTNNEDMFAWPCLLYSARSIYFLKEPLHTYSTDNEGAVMQSETFDPKLVDRRFQSRTKALLTIPFFREFAGEGYSDFINEHKKYEASYTFGFFMVNFHGKSLKEKEDAAIQALGYKSAKELYTFLRQWLPKGKLNSYGVFRLLGMNAAITYNHVINKLK